MSGVDLKERARLRGVSELIEQGCLVGGISVSEFYGRGKTRAVCEARHVVWLALRRRGYSYPDIGWLAGRDHTTVLSALKGMSP